MDDATVSAATQLTQDTFKPLLRALVADATTFTPAQAALAVDHLAAGPEACLPAQAAAFLTALKLSGKGEQPDILAACATAMRKHAVKLDFGALENEFPVDIVGTGGDGHDTFNVSTASGIVAAGAGAKVRKHGNRAATSTSGSADLLLSLGCPLTLPPALVPSLLPTTPFIFFFAPLYHPSLAHIGPTRRALPFRTVFNLLGPLLNPALPRGMIIGVPEKTLGPAFADALRLLGVERALVVCGTEGLDEISIAGDTWVWSLEDGIITNSTLHPTRDFGLPTHPLSAVKSSTPDLNAALLLSLLSPATASITTSSSGAPHHADAVRDFILLNSAALLVVAGIASDWKDGVKRARESMLSGQALAAIDAFREAGTKLT